VKPAVSLRIVDTPPQSGTAQVLTPADPRPAPAARVSSAGSPGFEWLAQSTFALVLVLLSAGLMAWSGYLRNARRHAPQRPASAPTHEVNDIDPATFGGLKQGADIALRRLLPDRKGFTALMARLDTQARQLGWNVSLDVAAPLDAPGGLEELTLHRAVMDLVPDDMERAGFASLLEWLDGISRLPVHAEIAALNLQGNDSGVRTVHLELHVFARNTHEATAAE
jgi:hypothetical protein